MSRGFDGGDYTDSGDCRERYGTPISVPTVEDGDCHLHEDENGDEWLLVPYDDRVMCVEVRLGALIDWLKATGRV